MNINGEFGSVITRKWILTLMCNAPVFTLFMLAVCHKIGSQNSWTKYDHVGTHSYNQHSRKRQTC